MSVYCAFNRSCLSVSPSILLCFEMINRVEGYPCAVQCWVSNLAGGFAIHSGM